MTRNRLATDVLHSLVEAYERVPEGRFTLTKAVKGRAGYRISHPGGNISVDIGIVDELIHRRLIEVVSWEPGFAVLRVTLRGFDFDARRTRLYDDPAPERP